VTAGVDRERGGLDTDDGRRSLMEALGPVAAALGGSLVGEGELDAADIPLRWHGHLVGGLRVPTELLNGVDGDLHGALGRMIEQVEDELGARLPDLSREGKQRAVRLLDERGAFLLRRSVEDVADALGVSRITVYNYLNAIRP
jgi:HTH domain